MGVLIRRRKVEDSDILAHLIASTWNTTYQGIVADEFLKGLLQNEKNHALQLRENIDEQPYYYVLTLDNQIIGWIYFTLESDKLKDAAEIHALYIVKEYQGKGYGKQLYHFASKIILENGIKQLVIGCLDGNPANEFYKHLGGKYIGNHLFRDQYLENIYLFSL